MACWFDLFFIYANIIGTSIYFLNTFNDFQNKAVSSYETFKIFLKQVRNKKAEQNGQKKTLRNCAICLTITTKNLYVMQIILIGFEKIRSLITT